MQKAFVFNGLHGSKYRVIQTFPLTCKGFIHIYVTFETECVMRLFINSGSPFARKCRVLVRELHLGGQVEEVLTDTIASVPEHVAVNPFAQIPALVTDEGQAIFDSTLICEWLAAHYGPYPLFADGEGLWAARQLEALGDGMLENCVKLVLESRRPDGERSVAWTKRWQDGLRRAFAAADARIADPQPEGSPGLADITIAAALTYADFRFPGHGFADGADRVKALRDHLEKRQSFIDTYPA